MKYILILLVLISCSSKSVMKECSEYKNEADSLFVCKKF